MQEDEIIEALINTGKFSSIGQIHGGNSAYAFKAHHTHLDRDVFLKVLDYEEKSRELYLREAVNLAKITQHQNIVRIYDCELLSVDHYSYLCLQAEFVNGSNLFTSANDGSVGQQDAIVITRNICYALAHLHDGSFIYRDLKLLNVMMNSSGVPKVTDFGSVIRLTEGDQVLTSQSRHSVLYMAPESFRAIPEYSKRSDIYQVGILLYELANGPLNIDELHYVLPSVQKKLGFEDKKVDELHPADSGQIVSASIAELACKSRLLQHGSPVKPYLSARLLKIVKKATHPDPASRYGSVSDMIAALNKIGAPNWKSKGDNYEALNWHEKDWFVDATGSIATVLKRKAGTSAYRRDNSFENLNILEIFNQIEATG